jgi:hypothetical protein
MAMAQPLLDVLDDSPDFFVARGNGRADILILAFVLVLGVPTILAAIVAALPAGTPRRIVHLVLVAALSAAFVLQLLKDSGWHAAVLIPLAALLGVAAAAAYLRFANVRLGLTVLSPLPLVVLFLFLVASPVSKLVFKQEDAAGATRAAKHPAPVVVLVLDEMASSSLLDSHGRIDATRYPNFAALARQATWYRNATTVADVTTAAVPALLSGRRPTADDLPIQSDFPHNLFTMLGPGYHLKVEEPITDLCPERLCGVEQKPPLSTRLRRLADDLSVVSLHLLAPDDVEDRLPAVDRSFAGFRKQQRRNQPAAKSAGSEETFENRIAETGRFLAGMERDEPEATLHLLHLGLPHVPWQYLPSGGQYAINGQDLPTLSDEHWGRNRWMVEQAYQRFLLQVGFADRVLGRVMARLRAQGLWDKALFVLAADHGVSFHADQERRSVSRATLADIAGIPLFVKLPRQRSGGLDESAVRSIDVLPTIAATIGVQPPRDAQGALLGDAPPAQRVEVFRRKGGEVTAPFAVFKRLQAQAVARKVSLFGEDDAGRGLLQIGPDGDLVGRPATQLSVQRGGGVRGELDGARLLASYRPDGPVVPAFVSGSLTGSPSSPTRLLVVVDGRIAGSTYSYDLGGNTFFSSMVPEGALQAGANEVRLIRVSGSGADRTFSEVELATTEAYRLAQRDGAEVILRGDDVAATVRAGAVGGYVERVTRDGGTLAVNGWSATKKGPADQILVFAGGKLVAAGRPAGARPDDATTIAPAALQSGFRVSGAAQGSGALRVFGLRGRFASQLAGPPAG